MKALCAVRHLVFCVGVSTLALPVPAFAQGSSPLQAGQIERQFQRPPEPGALQLPEMSQKPPANASDIRFKLTQLVVEGVTVYPESALRPYDEGMLDKDASLADVYAIAGALTARYCGVPRSHRTSSQITAARFPQDSSEFSTFPS